MKHEAEEQLLKTLNGQLKEMPAIVKTMVQQYQTSAIVLSIICGVGLIVTLIGTIWLAVFFYKKYEASSSWFDGNDTAWLFTSLIGGAASIVWLFCLIDNVIHACSPITSILSSLFGS